MNRHRLSSVRLVQFYLHRIRKLNPKLNAVITVEPDRARRRPAPPTGRDATATAGRSSGSR